MDNHSIFANCNHCHRKIIEFSRMRNGFFYAAHPFTKLMLVLFLMVTSYLVLFGLGLLAAITVFDTTAAEAISLLEHKEFGENINLVKMMQVLYSTGLFLLPALLAAFLIGGGSTGKYLSAVRWPRAELYLLVVLLMITIVPLINYIGFLGEKLALPEEWGLTDRIRENDKDPTKRSSIAVSSMCGAPRRRCWSRSFSSDRLWATNSSSARRRWAG